MVSESSASKGLGLTDEEIQRFKEIADKHMGQIVPREDVLKILELTERSGVGTIFLVSVLVG